MPKPSGPSIGEYIETTKNAVMHYEKFHHLPRNTATWDQVESSSLGITGWASYIPNEHDFYGETEPIQRNRWSCPHDKKAEKDQRRGLKASSDPLDHYLTEKGQAELERLSIERDRPPERAQLNVKTYANQEISEVGEGGWVQLELTADSGAVDSVMPQKGPWAGFKIYPSR